MVKAAYNFPRGFLWGTATSSYQVEGQNENNDWFQWEQKGQILNNEICGQACDWWDGRWKQDLDLAADAGQNAHRFSVEWSRVQPEPGEWDQDALDQYRAMAKGMVARGLTPLVTLHHFTNPAWIAEMGGWENPEIIPYFEHYVKKINQLLKDYVTLWCTINEPNVYAVMAYLQGVFPPGKKDLKSTFQVITNLFRAHVSAYHLIHQQQYEARVGLVIHYRDMIPARRWFPPDHLVSKISSRLFNDIFPQAAHSGTLRLPFRPLKIQGGKGTQDFLGINYYTQEMIAASLNSADQPLAKRSFEPGSLLSETGFIAHKPQGLLNALEWGTQFKLPLMVTENGIEDSLDALRPRYLAEHIHQVWKAINHNWPIKGYFHWTLVDNFEWERGWSQRFGLYNLERDTQERQARSSADFYARICQENALTSDMAARYAPRSLEKLFPDN